jgi:hypothetical protein
LFRNVERLAQIVLQNKAEDGDNSACYRTAQIIANATVSTNKASAIAQALDATQFIMTSRKGFYCMLCDHKSQNFVKRKRGRIIYSMGFCAEIIDNTLPYFLFRFEFFVKYSRLNSEFLSKCTLMGDFRPHKTVKYSAKFFRHYTVLGDLVRCQKGYSVPGAMQSCKKVCQRFHPTKFDKYYEGDLETLFIYNKNLSRLIQKRQRQYDQEMAEISLAEGTKRVLAD